MKDYKKLKIWEISHNLVKDVYVITNSFPKDELYGLTSQLRRSLVSIPNNIVEGCGREGQKEFINFLNISLGSTFEVEYLFLLSYELGYVKEQDYEKYKKEIDKVKRMIFNFKKTTLKNLNVDKS